MTAASNHEQGQTHAEDEVGRVADMLDWLAAGDVQLTITDLEGLLSRLKTAATARELLSDIDRHTLKAALVLRRQRGAGGAPR